MASQNSVQVGRWYWRKPARADCQFCSVEPQPYLLPVDDNVLGQLFGRSEVAHGTDHATVGDANLRADVALRLEDVAVAHLTTVHAGSYLKER